MSLVVLLTLKATGAAVTDQPPPNIIIILADDLGYGDLSVQGAEDMRTPHLDQLAQEGLRFTQFYANSTVCSPSRASLLSGMYPDLVGVPGVIRQNPENSWGYLAEEAVLLPQLLNQAGYHTAHIGKWHLGLESPNTPNERGFTFFKGFLGDMMDDYWTHLRKGVNWMRYNQETINPTGHATDVFTDWTLDYLHERQSIDQPYFLYLAYNAPHYPIQPPDEWLKKVKERESTLSEDRAKNVALIEHMDHSVGRIVDYLRQTGSLQNTLIIFTSDNGGALRFAQSNGRLRGGKKDMYEGGIRVPTFFYWPGQIEAGVTNQPAMLMDIYPTVCAIVNQKVPLNIDGINLLPVLLGQSGLPDDRSMIWTRREGGKYGGLAYYAIRQGNNKLVQNTPFEPIQFFDLTKDVLEQHPVKEEEDQQKVLKRSLQRHILRSGAIPWQPKR